MHEPFTNLPSSEGKMLLFPFRLHMHKWLPIRPTIWK